MEESELLEKLKHGATPHIRWMIRQDMAEVMRIEEESQFDPWTEDDFIRSLRHRNNIGMVAESGDRVLGFMIYGLHRAKLEILNFAVAIEFRRHGVGVALVNKLKSKLSCQRRTKLELHISDSNLLGQLFWKSQGFVATGVAKEFYKDAQQDAYRMVYKHREEVPA